MNNKEPITDGAPLQYSQRKDGVNELCNIKSDRFDMALDMTDKITKSHRSKREERHKGEDKETKNQEPSPVPKQEQNQSGNPSL